jgi:hypothetical protein
MLREILTTYDATGIQALVLKGAALSHWVYSEPGLRPMSDLDILVPTSDLWQAQRLLADLGFDAPLPPSSILPPRHLSAVMHTEGLAVQVEIHHRLLSDYFDDAVAYVRSRLSTTKRIPQKRRSNGLAIISHPFTLVDMTAHTLGYEDTLQHLCRHLASHVNVWDFARLIWVADVVSLAERFASKIDWDRVQHQYPVILNMLSLFHFMTPLSDELLSRAGVKIGRAPQGIGVEYVGWPRLQEDQRGWRRVLRDTLLPSEWWLRLRYKLSSTHSLFWYRWVRHPLYVLGQVIRAVLERLGWPTHSELVKRRTRE